MADYLFSGTNAYGKLVHCFRVKVTDMRDRIFGPYPSRSRAIECFDVVLDGILDAYTKFLEEGEPVMG